jgi:hypothetical protein
MIQSLPEGMGLDHTQVLKLAENNNGIVTHKLLMDELNWDSRRIESVTNFLVKEGIVWIDEQHKQQGVGNAQISFYFPSLFSN